ncbi:alcohol dehydrogenase catalytic domain-containing protein [Amycolatopsis rhabdoformis]|uniref:Alcohol dehydrogenase catalytic domain-containing protein n=1 Tax=Amycolatopsis rhabdoformis TaxID=1448059 RepID=A0ABZ1IFW0_9PSEU|nr:alcohol dehydrogenase catalytic domain-containing protein [Amycolatopsis rhabdoformis]WSE32807.1 alcohol dehydrogenase catalytic domain-containing protein [Amycolatopsis rhabdoformis]
MRAFVIHGPGDAGVAEVPDPVAGLGEVVVAVERAGVCGTDVEFFTGEMHYLGDGQARYPMRIGHEWCGTVVATGEGVHPLWVGRRVVGDTMLGCGHCRRCHSGHQHVCATRQEVGIRGGRAGALAEKIVVPVTSLHELPPEVDTTAGALVEPGGNALRAARAALGEKGEGRVVVYGPGTIGLLTAMFLRAAGAEVHLVGVTPESITFARELGFAAEAAPPSSPVDAVVDATSDPAVPAGALELVEPAGRLVCIGLAGEPSRIDSRQLALKDVTAVGILSASPGLEAAIDHYAAGDVDPRPIVAATVGLADLADVFAGRRPPGTGPKILVDPTVP